jgi:lipopolysaccharide transport system permease protein
MKSNPSFLSSFQGLTLKLDLLRALVRRDLEARYKGSVLGNLWPLVNQLSQLLIYTYVFSIVLKVKLNSAGTSSALSNNPLFFGLWLFAGLVPWIAFTTGLTQAAHAVVNQPNLVKKVVFPLELLPLVPILSTFIESILGLALLIGLGALTSGQIRPTLALLPLIWLPQVLLSAGFGYLVAGLTVFLRDVSQVILVLLNLWFYLTPIVYPSDVIPDPFRVWVLRLNPLATLVQIYRDLIIAGTLDHWREWAAFSIIAMVIFQLGLSVYQRLRPGFADVL